MTDKEPYTQDKLWALIEDLRAENAGLLEIIFRQQGLLEEKVIVPEASGTHVGREPWYVKKQKLERSLRVTRSTHVEEPEEDAS